MFYKQAEIGQAVKHKAADGGGQMTGGMSDSDWCLCGVPLSFWTLLHLTQVWDKMYFIDIFYLFSMVNINVAALETQTRILITIISFIDWCRFWCLNW